MYRTICLQWQTIQKFYVKSTTARTLYRLHQTTKNISTLSTRWKVKISMQETVVDSYKQQRTHVSLYMHIIVHYYYQNGLAQAYSFLSLLRLLFLLCLLLVLVFFHCTLFSCRRRTTFIVKTQKQKGIIFVYLLIFSLLLN